MKIEKANELIGKKASLTINDNFMTIKAIRQFSDMILADFEESNYTCNIDVLKLEDGKRIDEL